jgi:hypothetical protein
MSFCYTDSVKRLVALLVVSLTLVCLVEDLLALSRCAEDRGSVVFAEASMVVSRTQSSQQSCPPNSSEGYHDCLCCCRHVIPGVFFQPQQTWSFTFLESAFNITILSADLFPPYHPPQA